MISLLDLPGICLILVVLVVRYRECVRSDDAVRERRRWERKRDRARLVASEWY